MGDFTDEKPEAALAEGKELVAYYLAKEPHIMKTSSKSDDLLHRVRKVMGWSATDKKYDRATQVIPDDVARNLVAAGTSEECIARVQEYVVARFICPILDPMMDDIRPMIDPFAPH